MPIQNSGEILIFDDEPAIRKLVRRILEGGGFQVLEADSVKKAFEIAAERGPHAVIADLNMPDVDGFVFLERRNEFPTLKRVPVIVLSALGDKKSIYRAMSLGAIDYMVKPFQAKDLIQKLKKLLKDRAFLSHTFNVEERPQVQVQMPASVLKISEVGFIIEVPVRLKPGHPIGIQSGLLQKLKMTDCHLQTAPENPQPGTSGLYLSQVDAVGIMPDIAKHIRSVLKKFT